MNNPLSGAIGAANAGLTGSIGMANAISNTNSAAQQHAYNQAVQSRMWSNEKSKRMVLNLVIEQAGNGYIVGFAAGYGEIMDKQVATSIEQVQNIIAAEMASRMLEASA
jgi:hypothetical protein